MRNRNSVLTAVLALGLGFSVPASAEEEIVGSAEFMTSCASCHGVGGHGDGALAAHLDPKPTDLTRLAERNGGEFPTLRAFQVVDGRAVVKGHGDRAMPVWGARYRDEIAPSGSLDERRGAEPFVRARVMELVHYLTAIQEPRGETLLPTDE
ncbi:c-type cytochrome [Salinarimonas sp. NSM]|uniref:c-type cytochrome n=1 Tax=Salinarimonas sp. NSM TaxID=3458003 RepID=UPI00403590E4